AHAWKDSSSGLRNCCRVAARVCWSTVAYLAPPTPRCPAMRLRVVLACLALVLPSAPLAAQTGPVPTPQLLEFFETRIRPVLAQPCFKCHGPKKQMSGPRLDSRAALLKGGDDGPAIVPGDPEKSRLVQAVRQSGRLKMPPKERLPAQAV